MNCFEWQNQASDYLDGSLIAGLKREADEHLEGCESCGPRYKHYRLILSSISSQPRNALPVSIRKSPLTFAAQSKSARLRDRLRNWSQAPWYIRVPVEGGGIALLISLSVSVGPRLRTFYERKVEKSLTEYNEGFGSGETAAEDSSHLSTTVTANAMARGNIAANGSSATAASASTADEYSGSEGDSAAADDGDVGDDGNDDEPNVVKATSSDTWRFNLKTDSPHDVRTKIVKILQNLKVPSETPGIGGIEAPGGIQFDLVVPQSIISDLKKALEGIAPTPPKELADSPFGETFTWYKKRSRTPVPAGQTHVVIWLAQI